MSDVAEVEETAEPDEPETAEPGGETQEPSSQKPANEMKVVIIIKDDRMMLGVQSPNCDPVYTTMKGTLDEALERIPALVAEAKLKWEANPRYPKADLPEPPPAPTPVHRVAASQPAKQNIKPSFF